MRQKNDVEKIKLAIKQKVFEKSILAYKFAFNSNDALYQKALDKGNLRAFSISAETLQSVDKKCVVNGKRIWLYKIAIQELIDEGCLIVSNSYCKCPQNNYAKGYALTLNKLKEVMEYITVDVTLKNKKEEWTEDKDFMDGFDCRDTNGKWLSQVYCTRTQLKKEKEEFQNAIEYAEYCKMFKNFSDKNTYIYEDEQENDR